MFTQTICKDCNAQMKMLLTSFYCPNDCDRKHKVDKFNEELFYSYIPSSYSTTIGKQELGDCIVWKTKSGVIKAVNGLIKNTGFNYKICILRGDFVLEKYTDVVNWKYAYRIKSSVNGEIISIEDA